MSKKVGIIVGGYMRINFEKWTPNGVLMTIIKFYESGNIIPCRVYNHQYKLQSLKDDILCDNIVSLYVNWKSIYCITNGNDLYVKGYNTYGQLGLNHENESKYLTKNNNFNRNVNIISHGSNNDHVFILLNDNSLYGCGSNKCSQLGIDTYSSNVIKPQLINYVFDSNIIQIECGLKHSLFLTSKGNVYGCGDNDKAVLSNIFNTGQEYKIVMLNYFKNIIKIGISNDASFGLNRDGILYMFGSNSHGLLGMDAIEYDSSYLGALCKVNITNIDTFDIGAYHVCFKTKDNKMYAFGDNGEGQCGSDSSEIIHKPILTHINNMDSNDIITDIKCGYDFTIIKVNYNKYYGAGCNEKYELLSSDLDKKVYPFQRMLLQNINHIINHSKIIDIIPGCGQTYILVKS